MKHSLLLIGTSAGGIEALKHIINKLPNPFPIPIIVVQHLSSKFESYLPLILENISGIPCKEVEDKDRLMENTIYVAPPNYHVLVEKNFTLSLSTEKRVSYARPSIDVTFETAADAYKNELVGILLTGANSDGAKGMEMIHTYGGLTVIQDPETAYAKEMPLSALRLFQPDYCLDIREIRQLILEITEREVDTSWQKRK